MKKLFIPLLAVAALAVGASPAMPASTATVTVQIKRLSFVPTTAAIKTGDTVTWVNSDTQNHQVVSNNGSFVSPILGPGKRYSHTFNAAGTYHYHDGLNPASKGSVVVNGPPPAVTIGLSRPIVVYGEKVILSGTVSNGKANESVTVFQQPLGSSFAQLTTVLTSAGGTWTYVLPTAPQMLTQYEAKWNGRTSIVVGVQVQPRITLAYRLGRVRAPVFPPAAPLRRPGLAPRLPRFRPWGAPQEGPLRPHSAAPLPARPATG